MKTIAAATLVLLATLGCNQDDKTGDLASPVNPGGSEPEDLDLRTPANDEGCFPGELAADYAVCLCDDYNDVGRLSLLSTAEGASASMGVNGVANMVGEHLIEGSLHAHAGIDAVLSGTVRDNISTAGSFSWVGNQMVSGDLNVGGSIDALGRLAVGGTLRVGGETQVIGGVDAAQRDDYQPLSEPCDCSGENYFDVATAVADASVVNDNAIIDLETSIESVGAADLRLPSGRYYLDSWDAVGSINIVAEGNVALFVGGSIQNVGAGQLSVDGGTMDLYVAGSMLTVGSIDMGGADPSAFRLFIGGEELVNVGEQMFTGHIYAPHAVI